MFEDCAQVSVFTGQWRLSEYMMAKTHRRPCAGGTILDANESTPYVEGQLSVQHKSTETCLG